MYRSRDPQQSLFASSMLVPPDKAARLRKSWAEMFRSRALALIDEGLFEPMYHSWNGRPNTPVQTLVGIHLLKEMFALTDEESLEQLEFNLLWQHALALTPQEAHLCQKTLHNFRIRLIKHEGGMLLFRSTTERIVEALGTRLERQRLDSTHIVSNIAMLSRLGLFCETMRVFLLTLKKVHPRLYRKVPESLRGRYLKDDGDASAYGDARQEKARRRLRVCARDLWRLLHRFKGTAAAALEEYGLLERLLADQCELQRKREAPAKDDDDRGEGGAPVIVKEPKEVSSASLQTPHDPDVTYSGHKGKGYEVQLAETCHPENAVEIITHVSVTDSCRSDQDATLPVIEDLAERDLQPKDLVADTAYGSAGNVIAAQRLGTQVVSPVSGKDVADVPEPLDASLASEHFTADVLGLEPATCPAGHQAIEEHDHPSLANRRVATFDARVCESCDLFERCPARLNQEGTGYRVRIDLEQANLHQRRLAEARGEFSPTYDIRAGIEATNSELKRAHDLGRPRVRGRPRVLLAVCLKVVACNIKRMVRALMAQDLAPMPAAA